MRLAKLCTLFSKLQFNRTFRWQSISKIGYLFSKLLVFNSIRLTAQVMKNAIKNAIQYMSPGYFQLKVYYSIYELYDSYMEFAIFCNFFKLSNAVSYASSAVPLFR
jgi:hypothetical protein